MRLRWLKILLAGLLVLSLLLFSAVFLLTRTETGAGWALNIAGNQFDGLDIGSHVGSIHGGLVLHNIGFETPSFLLQADSLDIALRTEWFPFVLRVERLEADNLVYQGLAAAEEPDSAGLPESIDLPFPIEFPSIHVSGVTVLDEQAAEMLQLQSIRASASAGGELRLHELELVIEQGTINAAGQVALQNPFPLDLGLEAGLVIPLEEEPEPLLLDIAVEARGTLEGLDLTVNGTADPPRFRPHAIAAESRMSKSGMQASSFDISGPDLQARGSAAVDWEELWARLEDAHFSIPGTDLNANADLTVDLESDHIEGRIAWSGMAWPLRAEVAQWASRKGDLRLSGTLDNWTIDGLADVEAPGYPASQLDFDASGDRGSLEAQIHEASFLGGRLHGSGAYRWDDGGSFRAELGFEDLATESLAPEYPAILSGDLAASGKLEPLHVSLDVRQLSGHALGKPVAANGRIEVRDGLVSAEGFTIESGASRATLNGFPDGENGLAFTANIADLGDFLPDVRGILNASGTLFLRSGWPILDVEANGSDIGWNDIQVSSFTVDGSDQGPSTANSFDIDLLELRLGATLLDQVDARLLLGADRQAVTFTGWSGSKQLSAELVGVLDRHADSPGPWIWSGELDGLELVLDEQERIWLQKPVEVLAMPDSLSIGSGCLTNSRGAIACTEVDWSVSEGTGLAARIEHWPLAIFGELLGLQLNLSQHANGAVRLSLPPSGKPSGSADFQITAGSVAYTDDPDPILETGEGALAFTLNDGRLTAGVVDIPIIGQGVVDVDYEISDITKGLDADIRGTLLVDLADLDVLTVFLPKADRVSGTLKTDLKLSGTLGQPYFSGRLDLRNGLIQNRSSGLILEAIELSGDLSENRETRLTGSFRAAEGAGELDGLLDLTDIQRPQFKLGISGEKLKLFNSEDLVVVVDTDLSLDLDPDSVTIDGVVHVPSALLAPAVIPEQTATESPDFVIVAGRPAGEETEPEESQPISILGGLRFSLGEDVKLDIDVAELGLTGAVDFDWQGDVLPMANGRFNLSGEILAFGQLLEIAQGNIGFPGVPADNPHLNIRAEREIFGNSEVRRAGLLVAGTVRRPVIEPYTDPMTNRDRAQTLLVTGSDFNMERGVGAVNIGTYIAPRIFVSYGVGVFDDQNVLSIRYDLGRGWGVKATSGERQTGVDISYTLDQ